MSPEIDKRFSISLCTNYQSWKYSLIINVYSWKMNGQIRCILWSIFYPSLFTWINQSPKCDRRTSIVFFSSPSHLQYLVYGHNVAIFLKGVGTLSSDSILVYLWSGSLPFAIVVDDVNQDNRVDLVVGDKGSDTVTISPEDCWICL